MLVVKPEMVAELEVVATEKPEVFSLGSSGLLSWFPLFFARFSSWQNTTRDVTVSDAKEEVAD